MKPILARLNTDRFAVWAVPSLLLVVAAFHFVMVKTTNLTQWKGAGFGMFSTWDSSTNRWVRAYGIDREGEVGPLDVPKSLRLFERRARSQPLESRLQLLGRKMMARTWSVDDRGRANTRGRGRPLELEAIQLELWIGRYVSEHPRIDAEMLFEVLINADK